MSGTAAGRDGAARGRGELSDAEPGNVELGAAPADAVGDDADGRSRFGTWGGMVDVLVLAFMAGVAALPLQDNSFLTHLATGRIILDEGRVPARDPYSFVAGGEDWTVQSWLASLAYAGAESVAASLGLRVVHLLSLVVLGTVLIVLTRSVQSLLVRLAVLFLAALSGAGLWVERPYLIGVLGVAVVWLALDRRLPWWLLVPLGWLWANTHGSWALGLGLVVLVAIGAVVDARGRPEDADVLTRAFLALAGGIAAGAIGPVGPAILAFPLTALDRREAFVDIVEWQAPQFDSIAELAWVVLGLFAIVVLLTADRRMRSAVPVLAFLAASLLAQRNMAIAVVVFVGVIGRTPLAVGELRSSARPSLGRPVHAILAAGAVLVAASTLVTPLDTFSAYPGRAMALVGPPPADGGAPRLAAEVAVGNALTVLDGPRQAVFVDDRFDLYPVDAVQASVTLLRGHAGWQDVLERYDIDVVLWSADKPLSGLLAASDEWRIVYGDARSMVACRRDGLCPI